MPPVTHYDHKETLKYLPKHHKTKGLTPNQVNIFKALEKRYVHEGRTIDPSFLEGTNLRAELAAINFECLLEIDEPICPRFILEFYASINLTSDDYGRMSINFSVSGHPHSYTLDEFAQILGVPNQGTCLYTDKHSLATLDTLDDRIHPYNTPLFPKMFFATISLLEPPTLGEPEPGMRFKKIHTEWNSMNLGPNSRNGKKSSVPMSLAL